MTLTQFIKSLADVRLNRRSFSSIDLKKDKQRDHSGGVLSQRLRRQHRTRSKVRRQQKQQAFSYRQYFWVPFCSGRPLAPPPGLEPRRSPSGERPARRRSSFWLWTFSLLSDVLLSGVDIAGSSETRWHCCDTGSTRPSRRRVIQRTHHERSVQRGYPSNTFLFHPHFSKHRHSLSEGRPQLQRLPQRLGNALFWLSVTCQLLPLKCVAETDLSFGDNDVSTQTEDCRKSEDAERWTLNADGEPEPHAWRCGAGAAEREAPAFSIRRVPGCHLVLWKRSSIQKYPFSSHFIKVTLFLC